MMYELKPDELFLDHTETDRFCPSEFFELWLQSPPTDQKIISQGLRAFPIDQIVATPNRHNQNSMESQLLIKLGFDRADFDQGIVVQCSRLSSG